MTDTEELVRRLKAYADIENTATDRAQQESLARAADIVALYQSMDWVPEMDEHHPVGKRQFGSGPQHDPRSFARFTRWLTQVRDVDLKSARQYQLKAAHETIKVSFLHVEMKPRTEAEVRPFVRLAKQGYGDRIPDIWESVVDEGNWTARTVTEKIGEFRKTWTTGQRRTASAAERRSSAKTRAKAALDRAYELSPRAAGEVTVAFLEDHPDVFAVIVRLVKAQPDLALVVNE